MQRTRLKQVGIVAGGLVVATVMVLLGLWQMDTYRHAGLQVAIDRTKEPDVALASAVASNGTVGDIYARRVSASGQYRPDLQVLVGQDWPLRVVTALEMDDGRLVAVVRGAVSSPEVASPPTGHQDIVGVFLASDLPEPDPKAGLPEGTLASVRMARIAQAWEGRVIAGYVTLSAEDAAAQGLQAPVLTLPEVKGSAQNSGYALQWWVFAVAAIAASIWIARGLGKKAAPSPKQ